MVCGLRENPFSGKENRIRDWAGEPEIPFVDWRKE